MKINENHDFSWKLMIFITKLDSGRDVAKARESSAKCRAIFFMKNVFLSQQVGKAMHIISHPMPCVGGIWELPKILNFMIFYHKINGYQWKSRFCMKIDDFPDQPQLQHSGRAAQNAENILRKNMSFLRKRHANTHRFWHSVGCGSPLWMLKISYFMIFMIFIEIWHTKVSFFLTNPYIYKLQTRTLKSQDPLRRSRGVTILPPPLYLISWIFYQFRIRVAQLNGENLSVEKHAAIYGRNVFKSIRNFGKVFMTIGK